MNEGTKYKQIMDLVMLHEDDFAKHMAGNKTAGRRVRKALMTVKKLAHELRADITAAGKE